MNPKSDEGIFLGYSTNNKAYRVFNLRTKTMMESINVVIGDTYEDKGEDDDEVPSQQTDVPDNKSNIVHEITNSDDLQINKESSIRVHKDHLMDNIIGNLNEGFITRSRESISNSCFISKIDPKNVKKDLTDEFWINVMQEELG